MHVFFRLWVLALVPNHELPNMEVLEAKLEDSNVNPILVHRASPKWAPLEIVNLGSTPTAPEWIEAIMSTTRV